LLTASSKRGDRFSMSASFIEAYNAGSLPMSSEQWRRIESLYHEALRLAPAERAAYLDAACDDAEVRQEVESLLAQDPTGERFLEQPLVPPPPDSAASTRGETTSETSVSASAGESDETQAYPADGDQGVPIISAGGSDGRFVALLSRLVPWLAVAKIVLALAAIAIQAAAGGEVVQRVAPLTSIRFSLMLIVSFAGAALVLRRASPSDPRARALAGHFLVVATAFCRIPLTSGFQFGGLSDLAARIRLDVFVALFIWMFVRDFPFRVTAGVTATWPTRLIRFSAVACTAVLFLNIAFGLDNEFWGFLAAFTIPAAAVLVERVRYVGPGDRRRVLLFVIAICAGMVPITVDILLQTVSPAWTAFVYSTPLIPSIVLGALLSVPFTTAYSVVVDRVLDLRLAARAAMQYALARSTLMLLIIAPVLWTAYAVYQARTTTIGQFLASRPMPMGAALGALLIMLPVRRRLVDALDRRFFREHYDTDVMLSHLVDASRRAGSVSELTDLLVMQIESALHPRRQAVLIRHGQSGRFDVARGTSRSLPLASGLSELLGGSDEPVEVRPHRLSAALNALDTATLAWLADGDFRILVPLRGATGALNGIIALGEKRSELPYSARDRRMLTAVGATGGVWLDSRGSDPGEPQSGGNGPEDFAARECRVCGRISDTPAAVCACGGELRISNVPRLLAGKFEIERRIGAGGMGVVYRATDTALGRSVAVKALHGRHPRDAWRLRREARAMALITHPNLATVFGLEFWFARPFLVVEYVAGGTLADRLRKGSLPEREVAVMGTSLARVLGTLHASGLLHRDVKPANIGFTQEGVVKLLDFGLARPLTDAGGTPVEVAPTAPGTPDPWRTRTHGGHVVGTPLYMSPEALAGQTPDVTFDLWSLAVSLFEATAGVNPYARLGSTALLGTRPAPDLRQFSTGASDGAAVFFLRALSPLKRDRPASAQSFVDLVEQCFL